MSATLMITPTTGKAATLAGIVAVRESVAVTLVGLGARVDEGFVLRLLGGASILAICEQWTAGGTDDEDALGTLDLNTAELVALMGQYRQHGGRTLALVLWSLQAQEMVLDVTVHVRANHAFDDESTPQPVAKWGTDLTAVNADVAELFAAIEEEHAHDGAGSVRVTHSDLTGAGTVSHASIEAALSNLSADLNTHADRLAALEVWRAQAVASLLSAGDDLAALKQWRDSAVSDLTALATQYGGVLARLGEVEALAPVDLGWDVGSGSTLRSITGDSPAYGDLVKAVRTLLADLKARQVI
ncbi:MAG: hypothetical protein WCR06_04845 [bacterium]